MHFVEAAIFLLGGDRNLLDDRAIRVRFHERARVQQRCRVQPSLLLAPQLVQYSPDEIECRPAPAVARLHGQKRSSNNKVVAMPLEEKSTIAATEKTTARVVLPSKFTGGRQVPQISKGREKTQSPRHPSKSHLTVPSRAPHSRQPSWTQPATLRLMNSRLIDDEKRAVMALSAPCRVRFVQHVLRLLHWTEFLLLIEFTEAAIPIVYCTYLSVAYQLPNTVYYAQFRNADEATFQASISNILVYALLQALSLILLSLVLRYKLRISALHQLTFALQSQRQQVQSKLIFWMALSIQTPLDHFGVDYSFQFAWLRKSSTGSN